jgi:hypothetical protein
MAHIKLKLVDGSHREIRIAQGANPLHDFEQFLDRKGAYTAPAGWVRIPGGGADTYVRETAIVFAELLDAD